MREASRLSQSYIIAAPSVDDCDAQAARLAARAVCSGAEPKPCGKCRDCRKAAAGIHPDIINVRRMTGDKGRPKREIMVDQVRDMAADASILPNEAERKVYVIHEAELMNESAQNALLKILEEPPDYGAFLILSTNAERLLPTIRSRCAELQLGPVDEQTALPFLRQQAPGKPEQLLRAAYLRAGGFLGQALALLQGEDEFPAVQQLAAAYAARDRMGMLRVLLPMEKYKREQLLPLLQQLRACFCSALAQRGGFDAADQSAAQLVASRSGTELVQAADSLQTAIDDLAANASAGAVIGYLAMKLR